MLGAGRALSLKFSGAVGAAQSLGIESHRRRSGWQERGQPDGQGERGRKEGRSAAVELTVPTAARTGAVSVPPPRGSAAAPTKAKVKPQRGQGRSRPGQDADPAGGAAGPASHSGPRASQSPPRAGPPSRRAPSGRARSQRSRASSREGALGRQSWSRAPDASWAKFAEIHRGPGAARAISRRKFCSVHCAPSDLKGALRRPGARSVPSRAD